MPRWVAEGLAFPSGLQGMSLIKEGGAAEAAKEKINKGKVRMLNDFKFIYSMKPDHAT